MLTGYKIISKIQTKEKPEACKTEQAESRKATVSNYRLASAVQYRKVFLKPRIFRTRQCVYISLKNQEIISSLIRMMDNREITIGGYIDNILDEHFNIYKDEIKNLYTHLRDNEREQLEELINKTE
jgi:hypothetical protein